MKDEIEVRYNRNSLKSIEAYAKLLIGKTFADVLEENTKNDEKLKELYSNKARKGGLGNLLEEVYFGYKINGKSEADFAEAGVELKATPYEVKKDGDYRAGERLVLSMISYEKPIEDSLYESHMWEKCKLLLLVYYWRNKTLNNNLFYSIDYVSLFTPPKDDMVIIEADYKIISKKIQSGMAHELSEGDTMYLGACTKGATADKSWVPQYYAPDVPAKKRAFCYKVSYMTHVLNEYVRKDVFEYEKIIKDTKELQNTNFQDYCVMKVDKYKEKTDRELSHFFDIEYQPNNKLFWYKIALRMLDIKSHYVTEFSKANVKVKSIRIMKNGKPREQSPLPTVTMKALIEEDWENSEIYDYFLQTKFFFVLWQETESGYKFLKASFWHMPTSILETKVKDEWEKIVEVIRQGVVLTKKETTNGIIIKNNIPGIKDTSVIHMRPHTSRAAYLLNDGTIIGDYHKDGDLLPSGEYMTKQSFWLNRDFVMEQLGI